MFSRAFSNDRGWWSRYNRYLQSEGWGLVREACFRRDGFRCRHCGLQGSPLNPLQADHLTYENYNRTGRTLVSDLQTLCRHCHQIVTGRKFHRSFRQWLWRWWRRRTLNQKIVMVFLALLAVAWIHEGFFRPPKIPASSVTTLGGDLSDTNGNTLVIPARVRVHHRHHHAQVKLSD